MSHVNLRLLSSTLLLKVPVSSPSPLFLKPKPPLKFQSSSPFPVLSYYQRRDRRSRGDLASQKRRNSSTVSEERGKDRGLEMKGEKKEGLVGFNKRRAEGKDAGGKRQTLQHKTPKQNPINTICYVQILGTGMDTQDTSPSVLLFFDKHRFIFNAGERISNGIKEDFEDVQNHLWSYFSKPYCTVDDSTI